MLHLEVQILIILKSGTNLYRIWIINQLNMINNNLTLLKQCFSITTSFSLFTYLSFVLLICLIAYFKPDADSIAEYISEKFP